MGSESFVDLKSTKANIPTPRIPIFAFLPYFLKSSTTRKVERKYDTKVADSTTAIIIESIVTHRMPRPE